MSTRLDQLSYAHKRVHSKLAILRRVGLGVLVVLLLAALITALGDMAKSMIQSSRASKVSDVIITFGMFLTVVRRSL